jgi:hypothetical protein
MEAQEGEVNSKQKHLKYRMLNTGPQKFRTPDRMIPLNSYGQILDRDWMLIIPGRGGSDHQEPSHSPAR